MDETVMKRNNPLTHEPGRETNAPTGEGFCASGMRETFRHPRMLPPGETRL